MDSANRPKTRALVSDGRQHRGCHESRILLRWHYLAGMATIVLRARLVGGDHTDLTYEDPDQVDEDVLVDRVIEVLSEASGVLRCRHGQRLVALYARGVASIEVSPRGAIL